MAKNWFCFVFLAAILGGVLFAQRTEKLSLPEDPSTSFSVGETARLTFQGFPASFPLRALSSQQTRDALKAILKLNGGAPIIHIRAFSAGNGDLRRIPQIVADVLGGRHGPLPSVSVIQAGALTEDDAQIVLETVSAREERTPTKTA